MLSEIALQSFCWGGLLSIIYRQITTKNKVTFESVDAKIEHGLRIKTALFYMPYVSLSTFFVPRCMQAFIMVMIFQGVGECIDILVPQRVDPITKKISHEVYQFTIMDRIVQVLSLFPCFGFLFSQNLAIASLSNIFAILVVIYLVYLIHLNRKIEISDFNRLVYYWFAIMWVAWPLSHAMVVVSYMPINGVHFGQSMLTLAMATSWASDIGAYYIGKNYGKTKIMPFISPNKSLEGCIAGFSTGTLFCILCKVFQLLGYSFFPPITLFDYLFIGISISFVGMFGDMLESLVKRIGGVKDSGIFFPGHGGILDRFDTFLVLCPVTVYYLIYFVTDGPTAMFNN